jgi:hypothetical protein
MNDTFLGREWIMRKEGLRIYLLLVFNHRKGNAGGDDFYKN